MNAQRLREPLRLQPSVQDGATHTASGKLTGESEAGRTSTDDSDIYLSRE
jgi:hypothetical protein